MVRFCAMAILTRRSSVVSCRMSSHATPAVVSNCKVRTAAGGCAIVMLSRARAIGDESKNARLESGYAWSRGICMFGATAGAVRYDGPARTRQSAALNMRVPPSRRVARQRLTRDSTFMLSPAPVQCGRRLRASRVPPARGSIWKKSGMKKIPMLVAKSIPANTPVPIE